VDISKQQQFNQRPDGHENGAKMTAIAQLVTSIASATISAPSALRRFDARFSDVNARLSLMVAERQITPDMSPFPAPSMVIWLGAAFNVIKAVFRSSDFASAAVPNARK
jgi:hypothetical protein